MKWKNDKISKMEARKIIIMKLFIQTFHGLSIALPRETRSCSIEELEDRRENKC
jgi:hypothetical protein